MSSNFFDQSGQQVGVQINITPTPKFEDVGKNRCLTCNLWEQIRDLGWGKCTQRTPSYPTEWMHPACSHYEKKCDKKGKD